MLVDALACDYACSRSMVQRRSYMTLCECLIKQRICSKRFFLNNFYTHFVALACDKVSQIRKRFCDLTALIIQDLLTKADSDERFELVQAIDRLKNEID